MDEFGNINKIEIATLAAKFIFLGAFSYYSLKVMMHALDPTKQQKKDARKKAQLLLERLHLNNLNETLNEYELVVASQLIVPQNIDITWSDIGGLDAVIEDIISEVVLPMRKPELFANSPNYRPPTGVLLHGPPGCGKTMLAKATAREAGARFINLEVAMLTDKWYGESQKIVRAVFTLAKKIQPCIIFIDEIDTLLRSRDSNDHEATAMVKGQFMILWDGIETDTSCRVIIMGATNRPHDIDRAILRRMPAMYNIGLPSQNQRKSIIKKMVDTNYLSPEVDLNQIAELTVEFSGSDLWELYRKASMIRVKEYAKCHRDIFGFMPDVSAPSSATSSSENYSLLNGGDGGNTPSNNGGKERFRLIEMQDFVSVITKMHENKRLI